MSSALDRLQAWYLSQCDDEWEQHHVVRIESLDNPGWQLQVDLGGTRWAGREFAPVHHDATDHDWLRCWVNDNRWHAAAGPCNLEDAIAVFLDWVGAADGPAPRGTQVDAWLRQRWIERHALAQRATEEDHPHDD
jgi:hypothetical protein